MPKEILLSVKGMHFRTSDDGDEIETVTPAQYYEKDGCGYVLYEEIMEGLDEPVKNLVKFKDSYLEVTKKGAVNLHLLFEDQKKSLSNYATPFGSVLFGALTDKVEIVRTEKEIKITVNYTMEANYEFLSKCRLEMKLSML